MIEHIDQIFKATGGPSDFIDHLLNSHQSLDVLEGGFGWSITLLELAGDTGIRISRFTA